jgi:glycosyltransferase involved in cell wall biosynthesis
VHPRTIKVIHLQRKPRSTGNYSIENLFKTIRDNAPAESHIRCLTVKFQSQGFWKRIAICVEAFLNQSEINHVTGDINFATLFLKKRKTILTIHDLGFLHTRSGIRKYLLRLFWLDLPIRCCTAITVVSQAIKKELLEKTSCPSDKIKVIGIPLNQRYKFSPRPFNTALPTVLHIGTTPNKNLAKTIDALTSIQCCLVVVGHLPPDDHQKLVDSKLKFRNPVNLTNDDMLREYKECDIVSFVSTYEGFGMPIIEANAIGRVVITSNLSSMPEVAADAACLVDPHSTDNIRQGIMRVIDNPEYRERLIQNGLRNTTRFEPLKISRQYNDLYRQISIP